MRDADLIWKPGKPELVFSVPIVDVYRVESRSPDGKQTGTYYRIKPKDGVIVVPVLKKDGEDFFVMVRQWRHGNETVTTEFPSGIIEEGEEPLAAAERELREETGFSAGKLTFRGKFFQNPAIMYNTCVVFTAEMLRDTGSVAPDADEYIEHVLVPVEKLKREIGTGEFSHALTAASLFFHLRSGMPGETSVSPGAPRL